MRGPILMIVCPQCKGKGSKTDWVTAIGLNICGLAIAFAEKDNKTGLTRQKCQTCNGEGFIDAETIRRRRRRN